MPVPMSPTSAFLHKYVKSPIPTPMEVEPYSISKRDEDEPMDTSEQTDGVSLPPPRKICPATKPFESPRQKPIDGVVQPRTEPPPGKPTRHTNCLDFVLNTVLKDAMEHKCSWPFQSPVDTKKLGIPEYHKVIKKPMDLRTIEKRIRNIYYWNAAGAVDDIKQLFANCYAFNAPQNDVYRMAQILEKKMMSQIDGIPRIEKIEILPEHQRRTMFSVTDPYGKTETPKQCGRENTRGRKKGSDLDSHFDDEEGSSAASLQPPAPTLRQNSNSMTAPALANNQLNQLEKQGIRIKSSPAKTSNSISPALSARSSAKAPVPNGTEHVGPSPTKTRKQLKQRVPVASVASSVPYPPKGDSRESESKPGQSRKKLHTPGSESPEYVIPKKSRPSKIDPYVSIYGRKNVGLKMATLQQDFVNPALRIIQIGQFKAGQPVSSLRALCDEKIDFNKATDETILELLDYLQMVEVDKPRAGTVKTEMEVKAKHYGLHLFDDAFGMIAHHRIKPAHQRVRSNSPARSKNRSAVSDFDAHPSVKEASPPITKPIEPAKNQLTKIVKQLEKKPAKPQTKRLTILDDLLPNTPEKNPVVAPKKPVAATTFSSSSNNRMSSNTHKYDEKSSSLSSSSNSWMRKSTHQYDNKSSSFSSSSNNWMRKNTHQYDDIIKLKATYRFPSVVYWNGKSVTWLSTAPPVSRVRELTEQEKIQELRENEAARQREHEARLHRARNRSPSPPMRPQDVMAELEDIYGPFDPYIDAETRRKYENINLEPRFLRR